MSLNRGADAQGAAVNAELGVRDLAPNLRENNTPYLAASLRTKFSRDLSDGGIAVGAVWTPGHHRPIAPYVHVGAHVLQLGVFDRQFSFGMFGPFAEAGVVISPTRGLGITLGPSVQYDVRFTTSSQAWFGVNLGFVMATALD